MGGLQFLHKQSARNWNIKIKPNWRLERRIKMSRLERDRNSHGSKSETDNRALRSNRLKSNRNLVTTKYGR